jgi:hypothetical protein
VTEPFPKGTGLLGIEFPKGSGGGITSVTLSSVSSVPSY